MKLISRVPRGNAHTNATGGDKMILGETECHLVGFGKCAAESCDRATYLIDPPLAA